MCVIEDKTAVVAVASYRSVLRNPVRFKALMRGPRNMSAVLIQNAFDGIVNR